MELEKKKEKFEEKGLSIIGISYDPVATLADFSKKFNISYSLLSDADSKVIKAFGLLNTSTKPGTRAWGIPYPGIYIIDENLMVVSKQFEEAYYERPSANTILTEHMGELEAERTIKLETPYLEGTIMLSDSTAYPAQVLAFTVVIKMKEGFHLYGLPVAEGYVPLTVEFDKGPDYYPDPIALPETTPFTLPGLDEQFNILPQSFTLRGRVRIAKKPALGRKVVSGKIKLQACNNSVCYPPDELAFSFPLLISKEY